MRNHGVKLVIRSQQKPAEAILVTIGSRTAEQ